MSERKQVILFMTDTTRKDMLGCYGDSRMITPNLDRLAQEGIRYENAYSCQPVCGPARGAIFTGMFPHSNGVSTNSMPLGEGVKTIGQRLTDQQIHCGYIGKWHLDGGDYFGYGKCPEGWDQEYWYDMRCYLEELTDEERMKSRKRATAFEPDMTEGFTYAQANHIESVKSLLDENTCAVFIEMIQGEGGVMPLEPHFVKELEKLCKKHDVLLMIDEVQTGMGRTGTLFCYEQYGIEPDVITSSKALGGGLPIGACLCTERLGEVLNSGMHGSTFGGNPVACAGALSVLERVSDETFLQEVKAKGEYMQQKLSEMEGVAEVRGIGMMIGIVLEKGTAKDVAAACIKHGLLVLTAKTLVRLLPPLTITFEEIDKGLAILEKVIKQA